jgi:16S rRNA (cytosine1402-N4)-methyltransferase
MVSATAPVHKPVMLAECLKGLHPSASDLMVDCTFGRGGHSLAILGRLGVEGRLLALDKDLEAVCSSEALTLSADSRFNLVHGSFASLKQQVERLGWLGKVGGILMDLGVSSPQLDRAERGFSFLRDGPLDMRMNSTQGETAAEWLASVSEQDLADVLYQYGEERFSRRIAHSIVTQRVRKPIYRTSDLVRIIEEVVPKREKGKHPATRSFQAIRIRVNRELDELESGLTQALEVLKPGGRLVVISFHSLEDRIVKRFMRDQERGWCAGDSRHLIQQPETSLLRRVGAALKPDEMELKANVRSRSAVLRVAEKKEW